MAARISNALSKKTVGNAMTYAVVFVTKIITITLSYIFLSALSQMALACVPAGPLVPITDVGKTHIRKGAGEWGAARKGDGKHGGVDIIVRASHSHQQEYAVSTIAAGTVAYSQLNGGLTAGYGNVIVIDHGNDCYSLYAHLASAPFTPMLPGGNLLHQVGAKIGVGGAVGYMVDIKADVDSSGNAVSTAPEAHHQVHFEIIHAPSGRAGFGGLKETILKSDGSRIDPTPLLARLGYLAK